MRERRLPGPPFRFSAESNGWGPRNPRREQAGGVRPPAGLHACARGQSRARTAPPRYARPPAHAQAHDTRETGTARPTLGPEGGRNDHDHERPPLPTATGRTHLWRRLCIARPTTVTPRLPCHPGPRAGSSSGFSGCRNRWRAGATAGAAATAVLGPGSGAGVTTRGGRGDGGTPCSLPALCRNGVRTMRRKHGEHDKS